MLACAVKHYCWLLRDSEVKSDVLHDIPDISDVRGQEEARRVLEIAAAGGHHLLLIGSPGCGKTLLASRLPGLLPPASEQEALESASIASVSGHDLNLTHWRRRPYRAPHHSASAVALIGGGVQARPGEISLAHNGVLFMDELPEWQRKTLEALREPMESGVVTIARATRSVDYPARFQLVAAMNPCPCGWAGDSSGRCQCGLDAIRRYRRRISGPLLDRIDLQLEIPRLAPQLLRPSTPRGEHSVTVRRRVTDSRTLQYNRQAGLNAHLGQAATERHCCLDATDQRLLERAIEQLQLSARSMQRILRVARTIADLDGSTLITSMHLHEAIGYRRFDRTAFGIA